jgi:hypothetical protein
MDLDLAELRTMHPRLTLNMIRELVGQAALALERNAQAWCTDLG